MGCPGCLHLQQMSSALSAAEVPGVACFTPCPFLLLDLALMGDWETWLMGGSQLSGTDGACTKGKGGS